MSGGLGSRSSVLAPISYFLLPTSYFPSSCFPPELGGREARQSEAGGRGFGGSASYFGGASA